MKRVFLLFLLLSLGCTSPEGDGPKGSAATGAAPTAKKVNWTNWNKDIFTKAKREKKLILLDLGAIWCHWCHVMEEKTYSDSFVAGYLNKHFLASAVNQDAHPDLAARYYDWGWPATIIFDAEGNELAKLSGYIKKEDYLRLLKAFVADPTPGPSVIGPSKLKAASNSSMTRQLRKDMEELYRLAYDKKNKGWGIGQKWLDWKCVEYGMELALQGTKDGEVMAKETVDKQLELIDPVWGGVYQYSHGNVWTNPHFEKLTIFQAHNIRTFALAAKLWGKSGQPKKEYLDAALTIHSYLQSFQKSPDGAFYTSQDADVVKGKHSEDYFDLNDAQRRKQGIPTIDKSIYSRENGLVIEALATLYSVTGEKKYLEEALTAANWLVQNRGLKGGGFRHGPKDQGGPFLVDNINVGQALLVLSMVSRDDRWLEKAKACGAFLVKKFKGKVGFQSYPTPKGALGVFSKVVVKRQENVDTARFLNLLSQALGDKTLHEHAKHAMGYLLNPKVANQQRTAATLLADREVSTEAPHLVIVAKTGDKTGQALFMEALSLPTRYKVVECFDPTGSDKSRSGQSFPKLEKAAVFICAGTRCSLPVYDRAGMKKALKSLGFPMSLEK
jgi:uncharacterized protein